MNVVLFATLVCRLTISLDIKCHTFLRMAVLFMKNSYILYHSIGFRSFGAMMLEIST